MIKRHPRMVRESRTMNVMINMYCHKQHQGRELCAGCRELLTYAEERLNKCPFQAGKSTCAKCRVHCYQKTMREKIRGVMRYAGPRMIFCHPVLAVLHLVDRLKK
ncbi:MAG: nitrous oxide-stimulated promoter family protein [Dehalococcoidales bacterium]|nr:nitrous oxide-stimulated promoter family protein [Dehalococcoidales bacterium]